MAVEIYSTATEYLANALTFSRGDESDVVSVHVYHDIDPNAVPTEAQFKTGQLIVPPDPLAEGTNIDALSLIGPGIAGGAVPVEALTAGDYQRFVGVKTANEFIIRKVDTVTVR